MTFSLKPFEAIIIKNVPREKAKLIHPIIKDFNYTEKYPTLDKLELSNDISTIGIVYDDSYKRGEVRLRWYQGGKEYGISLFSGYEREIKIIKVYESVEDFIRSYGNPQLEFDLQETT